MIVTAKELITLIDNAQKITIDLTDISDCCDTVEIKKDSLKETLQQAHIITMNEYDIDKDDNGNIHINGYCERL